MPLPASEADMRAYGRFDAGSAQDSGQFSPIGAVFERAARKLPVRRATAPFYHTLCFFG